MSINDTITTPQNAGDVWLFNTTDNGDIAVPASNIAILLSEAEVGSPGAEIGGITAEVGATTFSNAPALGDIATTIGYETAVYLSLFGGNANDSTLSGDNQTWWGNIGEQNPDRLIASRTQFLLESIPAIPANINRIEAAILHDLGWVSEDVNVTITMPANNRLNIEIRIQSVDFVFITSWASQEG